MCSSFGVWCVPETIRRVPLIPTPTSKNLLTMTSAKNSSASRAKAATVETIGLSRYFRNFSESLGEGKWREEKENGGTKRKNGGYGGKTQKTKQSTHLHARCTVVAWGWGWRRRWSEERDGTSTKDIDRRPSSTTDTMAQKLLAISILLFIPAAAVSFAFVTSAHAQLQLPRAGSSPDRETYTTTIIASTTVTHHTALCSSRRNEDNMTTVPSIPKWYQHEISITAPSRGCHLITSEVNKAITDDIAGIKIGMANLFIQHTSASLTINENADPDVRR